MSQSSQNHRGLICWQIRYRHSIMNAKRVRTRQSCLMLLCRFHYQGRDSSLLEMCPQCRERRRLEVFLLFMERRLHRGMHCRDGGRHKTRHQRPRMPLNRPGRGNSTTSIMENSHTPILCNIILSHSTSSRSRHLANFTGMNSTSLATNLLALLNIHNLHPHRRSSLSIVKSSSTILSHPMIMDLIFDG